MPNKLPRYYDRLPAWASLYGPGPEAQRALEVSKLRTQDAVERERYRFASGSYQALARPKPGYPEGAIEAFRAGMQTTAILCTQPSSSPTTSKGCHLRTPLIANATGSLPARDSWPAQLGLRAKGTKYHGQGNGTRHGRQHLESRLQEEEPGDGSLGVLRLTENDSCPGRECRYFERSLRTAN